MDARTFLTALISPPILGTFQSYPLLNLPAKSSNMFIYHDILAMSQCAFILQIRCHALFYCVRLGDRVTARFGSQDTSTTITIFFAT